jgi:hypothetical protein
VHSKEGVTDMGKRRLAFGAAAMQAYKTAIFLCLAIIPTRF